MIILFVQDGGPRELSYMAGRRKDWRRIATRHDRCAHSFCPAIGIAAAVTFWLTQ